MGSSERFELVLESENVGAWMAINNAFTFAWDDKPAGPDGRSPEADTYWNGILVQLGRFRRISDDELMEGFNAIEFSCRGTKVGILQPEDFKDGIVWVNIVYAKDQKLPAYPRDFRRRLKLGEIKSQIVERAKPLHHYLQPFPGGITLWHENGYSIDAAIDAKNGNDHPRHVSHTFRLQIDDPDALRVEVLRLDRPECRWMFAEKLATAPGDRPAWKTCYGPSDGLHEQETKAQNGGDFHVLRDAVDRIVVTRQAGSLGQQIGKNPPQG